MSFLRKTIIFVVLAVLFAGCVQGCAAAFDMTVGQLFLVLLGCVYVVLYTVERMMEI